MRTYNIMSITQTLALIMLSAGWESQHFYTVLILFGSNWAQSSWVCCLGTYKCIEHMIWHTAVTNNAILIFLLHCVVYGGLWGKCSSYISTELHTEVSLIRVKRHYASETLHLVLCKHDFTWYRISLCVVLFHVKKIDLWWVCIQLICTLDP